MSRKSKRKKSERSAAGEPVTKAAQEPLAAVRDIPKTSQTPTLAVGVHGQTIVGGFIQTDEKDASLIGRQRYVTFSNMFNVSIVSTGVRYFLNLVAKAAWRAEPSDPENPESVRLAELVEDIMHDMPTPWHRIVKSAAMFRYYGFALLEWIAKLRDDGVMGMADIQRRPQATIEQWDVENDGTVRGAVQRSPQTFEEIYLPRSRLIHMVDDALSDSPEGLGLFRHLAEPVKRIRKYLQLEGWGYENDLRGIPIVRAPLMALAIAVKNGDIDQADADALKKPLEDFIDVHARNPEIGMMIDSQTWQSSDEANRPSGMPQFDASLLDGGNYSLEEVAAAIQRTNMEMARLLGIEHMLLGADGVGSLALAKDKSDNFALTVDSTLREIRETFQRDFLGPIWELNGWPEELKPKLQTEQITNRDINRISEALVALAEIGVVLSRQDKATNEYLALIGLSPLPALEEVDPDMAAARKVEAGLEQSADSKAQAATNAAETAPASPESD